MLLTQSTPSINQDKVKCPFVTPSVAVSVADDGRFRPILFVDFSADNIHRSAKSERNKVCGGNGSRFSIGRSTTQPIDLKTNDLGRRNELGIQERRCHWLSGRADHLHQNGIGNARQSGRIGRTKNKFSAGNASGKWKAIMSARREKCCHSFARKWLMKIKNFGRISISLCQSKRWRLW